MNSTRLLRYALRANALFSAATGVAMVALLDRLPGALDLPAPPLEVIGILLVGYGLALGLLSVSRGVASRWAVVATVMDLGWVIGSAALLALHPVPRAALVVATAAVVLALALLQLAGLRRAMFSGGVGRYVLERRVAAPVERAWAVVSDVARYAEVAGTLHRSEILSGSGVGLVRRCEVETCTRWEPGRAYAFEVDTRAPGYPLPLLALRGDFEVDALEPVASLVRVQFTMTPRGGAATELLLALLFALRGEELVGGILRRWAKRIEEAAHGATGASDARAARAGAAR